MEPTLEELQAQLATATEALEALTNEKETLTTNKQSVLEDLSKKKGQVQKFEELGDYDTLQALVQKSKDAKVKELEDSNNYDAAKEAWQNEMTTKDDIIANLNKDKVNSQLETQLRSEVTRANGSFALLEHQLRNRIDGVIKEGKVTITVNDVNGQPMFTEGKEATIKDLVSSFKENDDYAGAFTAATQISGSDTPVGGQTKVVKQPKTLAELTELAKSKGTAAALEVMNANKV